MKLDEKTLSNLIYIKRASKGMSYYSVLIKTRRSDFINKFHWSSDKDSQGQKVRRRPKIKSQRTLDGILLGNPDEGSVVALLKIFVFIALRIALVFVYMPINFIIVSLEKLFKKS